MIWALLFLVSTSFAQTDILELSLRQAEKGAVSTSDLLKSYAFDRDAVRSQADAQFETLLPRLSLQASYQYFNNIPLITIGTNPAVPFGTHSTYSFGPIVSYTLWDSSAGRKTYRAFSLLEKSREEERKNAELQILLSVRTAYVQVQLELEELRLIYESLELARAQRRDVATRYRVGAAAQLDVVTAERSVLNYEIQFKQRQAELSSSLKDLLALMGEPGTQRVFEPGPAGIPGVSLVLKLDPLKRSLSDETGKAITAPGNDQPRIHSQLLQAESFELRAESESAKRFPQIQLSGSVYRSLPNIPNPESFWQETIAVSLSMPLFLGDPSRHLSAQQRSLSDASFFRANQLREDIERDFVKAGNMLESLREQQVLAARDVTESREAAKLYYVSYKAGKINFVEVQDANLQALQASVNAARINAQMLNQLSLLRFLSGKDSFHD